MSDPIDLWQRLDRALARWRPHRQPISLLIDGLVIVWAWNATYLFRLGFERWWQARPAYDTWVMLALVALYLSVFSAMGIPRSMWRFSGFGEVKRLTLACWASGTLGAATVLMAHLQQVPRAVLALHPLVTLLGLCGARVAYRMLYEHMRVQITGSSTAHTEGRRAIVMGAGEAAKRLLGSIHHQGWMVMGLLDDDPAKRGARIGGVPVLGTLSQIAQASAQVDATHIITALPGASVAERRRAIELATATELPVLTVPSLGELQSGSARMERVRSIEPEDLLGRAPVQLDEAGLAELISGKTILVTGAGGSIGSELCLQLARYGPGRIVLFELSELALYEIEQQLTEHHPGLPLVRLLGDVKSQSQISRACQGYRPHLVLHAAAYKHVPLMESDNAWLALHNNTLGTWHAAIAAAESGAQRFVLISTDKAVNPTSVMGATKRVAEMVLSQLAAQGSTTRFIAVRFGNVLGSSGSVIPKFKAQIEKGGPVTVTHPDMTRFFMTRSEAARLVLQAAALAETGQVMVLDMGEPVKIVDLARNLIRLSGHTLQEIKIVFSGLRPGEKLYEELLADADHTIPTAHPRLALAQLHPTPTVALLSELQTGLNHLSVGASPQAVQQWLRLQVPEYQPS